MNEIIRKIDELLEELPRCCNANYMKDGCVYKMKKLVEEVSQTIQAEQNKPKTKGDVIRECNESLAYFIQKITDNCITGKCLECELYKACDHEDNSNDIAEYLNQPVDE